MIKRFTKDEKEMIESCFTYGMTWLEDNRYLQPIIDRVGIEKVEKYLEYLESHFKVEYNVSEDSEGCTYNSLVKI